MVDTKDDIVQKVLKEFERQQSQKKKEHKDFRLRNTKILLREYRKLKAHVDIAPEAMITPDEYKLLSGGHQDISTLQRYKISTKHLLQFVDAILKAYKDYCQAGDRFDQRRWQIINRMYLAKERQTLATLGDYYHIDSSVVGKERNKAVQDLSIMLFGMQGLDDFFDTYLV
ncbi:hypothetical protein ACNAN0_03820 [Agrilactobacillus fermenti]|uniref:hypothetical protein n=1 Tax=Agrilactobacillus fermenti TaxID=2586909 RepID=UPI003A5C19FC